MTDDEARPGWILPVQSREPYAALLYVIVAERFDLAGDGVVHQPLHARIDVRGELPLVVGGQAAFEAKCARATVC